METPLPEPEVDVIEDLEVPDDQAEKVAGGDHTDNRGYGTLDG